MTECLLFDCDGTLVDSEKAWSCGVGAKIPGVGGRTRCRRIGLPVPRLLRPTFLDQPKAIVSSAPVHKIEHALRVCGLANYFGENIYSSYTVGIWNPDPRIFLNAAEAMGFSAHGCAAIDGGPVGVEAACKAGMKTFFYNRFDEPCEFPAAISFRSMRALPGLIRA